MLGLDVLAEGATESPAHALAKFAATDFVDREDISIVQFTHSRYIITR